jgi:NAD(P)H-hydrate repair Nnr-like enzyme with NAD(P)H-hydrate epimerase domain
MADYKIVIDGMLGFGVEVTAPGSFRSVRGFPTEAAARRWIADQMAADPQPGMVSGLDDLP